MKESQRQSAVKAKRAFELQRIDSEISKLQSERSAIQKEVFKEMRPTLDGLVGKTFVYRDNNYGSGGKWDTFVKVLRVKYSGIYAEVFIVRCQINCEGSALIENHSWHANENGLITGGYLGYSELSVFDV